jgi:NosR/NirI family nitrous oxide reductase transcriptional regulator
MNECFYCLDCQVAYYDDQICPPMVWRRKRQQFAIKPALAGAPDRALIERGTQ